MVDGAVTLHTLLGPALRFAGRPAEPALRLGVGAPLLQQLCKFGHGGNIVILCRSAQPGFCFCVLSAFSQQDPEVSARGYSRISGFSEPDLASRAVTSLRQ